jgi:hypothetical protein
MRLMIKGTERGDIDNECDLQLLPDVPSMNTCVSIYRVVRNCHYNTGNDPFNYHTLRHNSHEVIMVFQYLQQISC